MIASQPNFCHICGRQLSGRYYQYDSGLVVCATCDDRSPRCARCNVPLPPAESALIAGRVRLCRGCRAVVSLCASCNEPIIHEWYTFGEIVPAPERRFCTRCVQSRPRCDLCHAPTSVSPTVLSHGQFRCALCASDMVLQEPAIRSSYVDAVATFQRITGRRLETIPPLHVVGRLEMTSARRQFLQGTQHIHHTPAPPPQQLGRLIRQSLPIPDEHAIQREHLDDEAEARHTLGFFVRTGDRMAIYIEMGLTRGLLLGTLTHELGHAWQSEQLAHGTPHLDPLIEEGFAEWIAYHALKDRGYITLTERATKRDDLYGRGLRHFLAIERARGLGGVLSAALGSRLP